MRQIKYYKSTFMEEKKEAGVENCKMSRIRIYSVLQSCQK